MGIKKVVQGERKYKGGIKYFKFSSKMEIDSYLSCECGDDFEIGIKVPLKRTFSRGFEYPVDCSQCEDRTYLEYDVDFEEYDNTFTIGRDYTVKLRDKATINKGSPSERIVNLEID